MSTNRNPEVFPAMPEGTSALDQMIEGLRKKDPELNAYCADILIRAHAETGTDDVRPLVVEAVLPGRLPHHRIRILDVILRIGKPLTPNDVLDINMLAMHNSDKVREKAIEVITALRPAKLHSHGTSAQLA